MNLNLSPRIAQRQGLVMTGQLQQAIALLQLSNPDLESFMQAQAQENPFLRVKRGDGSAQRPLPSLPMGGGTASDEAFGSRLADHPLSLYAHVSAQFDMMFSNPRLRLLADGFLEALEPNGWLGEPLPELAQRLGLDLPQAEAMLERVQQVEPAGLFARTLAECLALQAKDQGLFTPMFSKLLENLPRLAAADLPGLCRVCGCDMATLKTMLRQLRGFNPKPGADFSAGHHEQRAPDLIVTKGDTGWQVDLNRSTLPTLVVDETTARKVCRDASARDYVGERLGVARWLKRAVEHRNQTTLAVGAEIVRRQTAFLEKGPAHIQPMTLADVALAIGVHESTVSRVTTGMLIVTPQGTFGLKRFFSAALSTDDDSNTSAESVRYRIQKLVDGEDPKNPLSDDAIAAEISKDGTHLARRTVAKYRDMLKIPSSFQRRRQGKLGMI